MSRMTRKPSKPTAGTPSVAVVLLFAASLWFAHPLLHHHDASHGQTAKAPVECSLCVTGADLDHEAPSVSELIPAPQTEALPVFEATDIDYESPLLAFSPTRGPPA